MFQILKTPEYVFKTFLWGPETTRKKYSVVFEKFSKRIYFFRTFFQKRKKRWIIFLVENFPIFHIQNIPIYVFKTFLWGLAIICKKC